MQRRQRSTSLMLEALSDRIVPSVVDLTHRGDVAPVADGIVRQLNSGNAYTQPFLRVRANGVEEGYNTNARPHELDQQGNRRVTHAIKFGHVPRKVIDGVAYREFRLDVNQNRHQSKISLDEVQIFLAGSSRLTGYENGQLDGRDPIWDMDSDGDVSVLLESRLNRNRRRDDMVLFVPEAAFAGASANTFVYLYSKLGELAGAAANGGAEEWGIRCDGGGGVLDLPIPPPPPPPPPAIPGSLAGVVYQDLDGSGSLTDLDLRLSGVTIQLRATLQGEEVEVNLQTNGNGEYLFDNLVPGTYSIFEEQPGMLITGMNEVGSLGGTIDTTNSDRIIEIVVGSDEHGINYNFQELSPEG